MKIASTTLAATLTVLLLPVLSACGGGNSGATGIESQRPSYVRAAYSTDLLIYHGTATATGDAEAIESIADDQGLSYRTVTSNELDAMSLDELADHGAIVWPGGYAGQMSSSLDRATRDRLKQAVRERGVGFVGFCAGAFIAVSPSTSWGLSLVEQETLDYYHLEDEGVSYDMVDVQMPGGEASNLVWWGGPKLPEFSGGVIGRYTDTQEPAIAQTWAGNGLLVISGPHPEAPTSWRSKLGLSDSDGLDQTIAADMILAALRSDPMPSF